MTNTNYGIASYFSYFLISFFSGCFGTGILSFFCGILLINLDYKYQLIISCGTLFIICGLFVWNNDKENKKEFKKFDKMPKRKKYLWSLITLLFLVTAIVIWLKGMIYWGVNVDKVFNN